MRYIRIVWDDVHNFRGNHQNYRESHKDNIPQYYLRGNGIIMCAFCCRMRRVHNMGADNGISRQRKHTGCRKQLNKEKTPVRRDRAGVFLSQTDFLEKKYIFHMG